MRDAVVTLAVTRMLSGMCTGGISRGTGNWVRPVKEFGTVLLGDLTFADKTVIRPFDVVEYDLIRHRPQQPHIEDWVCDFVRARPKLVGRLDGREREEFLAQHSDADGYEKVARLNASLALVGPAEVAASFTLDAYSGRFDARLSLPDISERPIPVTDIKWRALGRSIVRRGGSVFLPMKDLLRRLEAEKLYVALGLSRTHEGQYWPLVVGVHTIPDYEAQVDYRLL